MKDKTTKKSFDPTKITGPYPVLAIILAVLETLLFYWLRRAETGAERMIIGAFMLLTFAGVLVAILMLDRRRREFPPILVPGLPEPLNVAKGEATAEEIKEPDPEAIAGPDASYIINRPPRDWTVLDLTQREWLAMRFGIAKADAPGTSQSAEELRDFRIFRPPHTRSITPVPGRTLIDGRAVPSALEMPAETGLTVWSIDRAQPPLFVERSLVHNFTILTGTIAQMGLCTMRTFESGTIRGSQRPFFKADFSQRLEHIVVDGRDDRDLDVHISVIGIEGDVRDYILILNHVSSAAQSAETEPAIQVLKTLVDSFRPLRVVSAESRKADQRRKAEEGFQDFVTHNKNTIMREELRLLFARIEHWNLDDPSIRKKIVSTLQPFAALAKQLDFHELDDFWQLVANAEKGDFEPLRLELMDLRQSAGQQPTQQVPQLAAADPTQPTAH